MVILLFPAMGSVMDKKFPVKRRFNQPRAIYFQYKTFYDNEFGNCGVHGVVGVIVVVGVVGVTISCFLTTTSG